MKKIYENINLSIRSNRDFPKILKKTRRARWGAEDDV